jgi:hypothetical protein
MPGVNGKLPLDIGSVTELTTSELEECDFSDGPLPESIVMCTKLEYISLYKSEIPSKIPDGFSALEKLGIRLDS